MFLGLRAHSHSTNDGDTDDNSHGNDGGGNSGNNATNNYTESLQFGGRGPGFRVASRVHTRLDVAHQLLLNSLFSSTTFCGM